MLLNVKRLLRIRWSNWFTCNVNKTTTLTSFLFFTFICGIFRQPRNDTNDGFLHIYQVYIISIDLFKSYNPKLYRAVDQQLHDDWCHLLWRQSEFEAGTYVHMYLHNHVNIKEGISIKVMNLSSVWKIRPICLRFCRKYKLNHLILNVFAKYCHEECYSWTNIFLRNPNIWKKS